MPGMEKEPDGVDRRASPRIDKVQLVQISRFDEEGFRADLTTGRTLNISRGGVRLELHHAVPLRTVVSLNLVLGERILDLHGVVVYLEVLDGERCGLGIEFTDLDFETKTLLSEFVDRFEARATEPAED